MSAPEWLIDAPVGLCPCGCIGTRTKGGYVAKTLRGFGRLMQQTLFADDLASRPGLLQRLDPRLSLLILVGAVVTASLVHSIVGLTALYGVALLLAAASRVPVLFFVRRVWLFVPLFTALIAVPIAFTVGPRAAVLLVLRVAVSVSFAVLITLTQRWTTLLRTLRRLGLPRAVVTIIAMTMRYVFVLADVAENMYVARRARTPNPEDGRSGRAFVSASAGVLFGKSYELADEVHLAMRARGYG